MRSIVVEHWDTQRLLFFNFGICKYVDLVTEHSFTFTFGCYLKISFLVSS